VQRPIIEAKERGVAMSEVKVSKEQSLTKREMPTGELFTSAFPFDRFFGLSPFSWMREMTREMDRVLRGGTALTDGWAPTVDIQQCNGTLTVTAELPGLQKEEVKVEITDEALIIEGERKREHKEDHEGYHRWERSYGHFYRSIPLPEGAKTDQAKAELDNGVLKVSMPVPEVKKRVRQVTIEEGTKAKPATA
jgi:HSP20 family protein